MNTALLHAALRRTVLAGTCALLAVCALAIAPGAAQAIDQWGPLGQIDGRDGSLAELGGVAVAPDGSAIYAVDVGQPQQTDNCGQAYTPIVVHRYALSAGRTNVVSSSSVTLAGDMPFQGYGETSVPIAVATGASGQQLLLLGFDADHDVSPDGSCTSVTDPPLLTELDATTLASVRALTRSQLGGFDVERLAVSPGSGSAADTVWTLGVPTDTSQGPSLTRWSGVPGDDASAPAASYQLYDNVLPPSDGCYPPSNVNSAGIAAAPDGSVLLQVGIGWWGCTGLGDPDSFAAVYRVSADGVAQQPPIKDYLANDTRPLPLAPAPYFYGVPALAVDPASGDMFLGEYANSGPGVQQLDPSGNVIRAWGPQPTPDVIAGHGTNPDCTFSAQPGQNSGLYVAAAPGLVVAANVAMYDPTQPPDTTGPLISWFGAGTVGARCLLTARPTAALSVTPASGASVGGNAVVDASASTANTSRPIDADNKLTYRFEYDSSGYGPPTTNPVFTVPLTHSGSYPLGVLVTDSYGQEAEARIDYTVSEPAPVAVLTASDLSPRVGETVTLDGSKSKGTIQRYQFDLDGSGSFATDNLSNPTVSYKFTQSGPVNVGLRVTDDQAQQATTTLRIDVQPAPPPPPVPVPATGTLAPAPGDTLRFDAGSSTVKPSAALYPARVLATNGRLKVSVDCLAGGARCRGKLWLSDIRGRRISSQVGFAAAPGQATVARPLLSAADRALLKRRATLSARIEARMGAPDGVSVTDRITHALRRPAAWAPKKRGGGKPSKHAKKPGAKS